MIIDLHDELLQELTENDIENLLLDSEIIVQVPLPSINSSNSYLDIISNYLDASFVIERISNKFEYKKLEKNWSLVHYPVYHLCFSNTNPPLLAKELKSLIWAIQYPENKEDETDFINIREEINDYEAMITEIDLHAPDVVDDYHANLINGAYYELEYDVICNQLRSFPERWYGYWVAAKYNNSECKVLVSADSWIIPIDCNLESAFHNLDCESEISLLSAHSFMVSNKHYAILEEGVFIIPMGRILQAIVCFEEHIGTKNEYYQKLDFDEDENEIFVSEFFDFFVVKKSKINIVCFDVLRVRGDESKRIMDYAAQLFSSFEDRLVIDSEVEIDWAGFNDEKFEQLCYDIIYHNSRFDRNTIRKMGKSKSRDGGRDIVVHTKSKIGEKPKKYIFQCKLSNSKKSINTSNVGSISDVIDQYGAEGYGLMCNCYIDATLYDRLDGISNDRKINIETWSALEIERFLARRPLLKQRYKLY